MRPQPAAADTTVPDDRFRELFLDLALAALSVPAVDEPKGAPRNGRRRRGRGKGWVAAKARTRSTTTAAPISTRSTPSAASSVVSHARHDQAPRPPQEDQR
jgi:hypothetical protein